MQKDSDKEIIIGLISDTHGLLRPGAEKALENADMIIHAGDIGDLSLLKQLEYIAPVVAVRGNMDGSTWGNLHRSEIIEKHNVLIYVIHDLSKMDIDPAAADIRVVVSGHTHKPSISRHKDILYVNPGSAGPRRFTLPVSVGLLFISENSINAKIVKLNI